MTAQDLNDLWLKGKYQEVLDLFAQKEAQGKFATFTEDTQIECLYYKSRALERSGQIEASLKLTTAARKKYVSPPNKTLLLALIGAHLYALWRLGRLDEALDVITEGNAILEALTPDERNTGVRWRALFAHLTAVIYHRCNRNTALKHYQQALVLAEASGDPDLIATTLNNLGVIHWEKEKFDKALDYHQRALAVGEETNNLWSIGYLLNNIGDDYRNKGELDTALKYYQRSFAIRKELDNPSSTASGLTTISWIYWAKGELDTALDYRQKALTILETTGDLRGISNTLSSIGRVHRAKDELDSALDYYQRAVALQKKLVHPKYVAQSYTAIGEVYRAKNNPDMALSYFQQALAIQKLGEWHLATSQTLLFLILLSLDQQEHAPAQTYLTQLQELSDRMPNKWIDLRTQLAKALVLKRSPRMVDKTQAQTMLRKIVSDEILDFDYTALAMIHLCDLLVLEVKSFGASEAWEEIKALTQQLSVKAKEQHSFVLIGEALLLQAKFVTIEGELQQALEYFAQARLLAEEKNLGLLAQKVAVEENRFKSEFEKWQKLIQRNASLHERLKQAELEDYIQKAQKLVDLLEIPPAK
ncbi:MAG: tetratricopeptide repeat protein [Promethearchaeota archaeon]